MLIEKVDQPLFTSKKPLYRISYYQHSYGKVKWANIALIRKNQQFKNELAHMKQKLTLYVCKEGLDTLVKVVKETR